MVRNKERQLATNITWTVKPPTAKEKREQIKRLRICMLEVGDSHIMAERATRKLIEELKKILPVPA